MTIPCKIKIVVLAVTMFYRFNCNNDFSIFATETKTTLLEPVTALVQLLGDSNSGYILWQKIFDNFSTHCIRKRHHNYFVYHKVDLYGYGCFARGEEL